MAAKFTQFGLACSFLEGLYDDHFTFKALAEHGDFGHGTFNAIDGEMIALEGQFYRADADGNVTNVHPEQLTPIATLTHFQSDSRLQLQDIKDFTTFKDQLTNYIHKKNIIYAIRVDATFESLLARSEEPQTKPYQAIKTSMPKLQHSFLLEHIRASLVGYFVPDLYKAIVLPGFHLHFIDDTRTKGGHVFDFKFKQGTVNIQYCTELSVMLPLATQFDQMDLNHDTDEALRIAERGSDKDTLAGL